MLQTKLEDLVSEFEGRGVLRCGAFVVLSRAVLRASWACVDEPLDGLEKPLGLFVDGGAVGVELGAHLAHRGIEGDVESYSDAACDLEQCDHESLVIQPVVR